MQGTWSPLIRQELERIVRSLKAIRRIRHSSHLPIGNHSAECQSYRTYASTAHLEGPGRSIVKIGVNSERRSDRSDALNRGSRRFFVSQVVVKMTNREEFFRLIERFNKIGSMLPEEFDPHDIDQRTDVKMFLAEMRKLEIAIKEFKP